MPPKKQQKQSLADFLAQTGGGGTTGNWADEMEDLPLAPSAKPDGYDASAAVRDYRRGAPGAGDRSSRPGGDRDGGPDSRYPPRPERAEIPIPDVAPFTAFIGNLAFETGEEEIRDFVGAGIKSVRLVRGQDEKPKGFGYVELETRDQLVSLLARTGEDLLGRPVRLSVAEPQREDRTSNPWRRDGPPPTISSSSDRSGAAPSRNYSFNTGPRIPDEDRGERMGFGSKFVPASERPPERERPGFGSMRRESSFRTGPGLPDEDRGERMGMGAKFSPSTPASPGGASDGGSGGFGSGRRGPGGLERQTSQAEGVRDWRSAPRAVPLARTESSDRIPGNDSAPPTRRRLELAPRSNAATNAADGESPIQSPSVSSKPSPFGSAAPVDTASREREIESKVSVPAPTSSAGPTAIPTRDTTSNPATSTKPAPERKASVNPFGAAAPVDTASKEREVEEKLAREKADLAKKAREEREKEGERKILQRSAGASSAQAQAQAQSVPGAPTGPKALQRQQSPRSPGGAGSGPNGVAQRRQSTGPAQGQGQTSTPTSPGAGAEKGQQAKSSLRKEGFSYSSMAKSVELPTAAPAEEKPKTNGTVSPNGEADKQKEGDKKVEEVAEKVKETSIQA